MDPSKRRKIKVAVAISKVGGVFCKEVTGTEYDGYTPKPYSKKNRVPYDSMGAEEYCDFLTAAWNQFMRKSDFRDRVEEAFVVHDRDPVHRSTLVQEHATHLQGMQKGLQLLPPRSPDMQPLDYGIFGTVKTQLDRLVGLRADWSVRATTFMRLIREASIHRTIDQFPLRLQACIQAGGKHIDHSLKEVKHQLEAI